MSPSLIFSILIICLVVYIVFTSARKAAYRKCDCQNCGWTTDNEDDVQRLVNTRPYCPYCFSTDIRLYK